MDAEWVDTSELHGPAFEVVPDPPPWLVLFGAVELAAACLGWRGPSAGARRWWIPAHAYLLAERFPDADELIDAWPAEAFARLGRDRRSTAVALLTHDPVLDDPALEIALRSPAMFVGAMGSRRTQERRRVRLMEERGLSSEEVDRLSGPIGLDLGARTATETALSILGEIVAVAPRPRRRDGCAPATGPSGRRARRWGSRAWFWPPVRGRGSVPRPSSSPTSTAVRCWSGRCGRSATWLSSRGWWWCWVRTAPRSVRVSRFRTGRDGGVR